MSTQSSNNKRIAKNTLLLYFRMFIMMVISFYTSRVILQILGVEDFGLYNIVGGVVVLFSILNGALSNSTQRFLNFEIGKGLKENVTLVFRNSLSLHLVLILIVIILSETVGLWYVNTLLSVPEGRLEAANYVYQFSILTFTFNIFRVPFNASIIAYERMGFYAYISIIEAALKLLVVYMLYISDFDKLILYGFLIIIVTIIICLAYVIYCLKQIPTVTLRPSWEWQRIKSITSFSGWNLFGSVAVVSSQQGMNMILNYFCGVALNAATGVAGQVTSAIYGFISNFQVAFNPQIVKLYAQNNREEFMKLIFRASKFSFILFWMISLPVLLSTSFILDLWLGKVPEHAVYFTQIIIIYLLIDALNGPLWTAINATGKIHQYQILMSSILILNLPVGYFMLYCGWAPESVWLSRVFFNLVAMIARLIYIKKILSFPIILYVKQVLLPIFLLIIGSIIVPIFLFDDLGSFINLCVLTILCIITIIILSYILVLSIEEKNKIVKMIKSKIVR